MLQAYFYRQGWVEPQTKDADKALLRNDVEAITAVRFYELSEEVFEGLWEKGLFKSVNKALGTMLDEFEEETINPEHIPLLKKTVVRFKRRTKLGSMENEGVTELISFCESAIKSNFPLFVVL